MSHYIRNLIENGDFGLTFSAVKQPLDSPGLVFNLLTAWFANLSIFLLILLIYGKHSALGGGAEGPPPGGGIK